MSPQPNYFDLATKAAQHYRDQVVETRKEYGEAAPSVVVVPLIVNFQHRYVPCGEISFPRCVADVFESGILTITSVDDGATVREIPADRWECATVYGSDDQIQYVLQPGTVRR